MWNGSVWVTTAVGTSPMFLVSGATRAAMSTASSRPRTWSIGPAAPVAPVGPVARREELARSRLRLAPRGGVPAGAVERDGEVQGGWSRHDQNSLPISPSTQRARRPPLRYQGLLRYQGFRSPSQGLMLTPRAYVNPFNAIPIGIVEKGGR